MGVNISYELLSREPPPRGLPISMYKAKRRDPKLPQPLVLPDSSPQEIAREVVDEFLRQRQIAQLGAATIPKVTPTATGAMENPRGPSVKGTYRGVSPGRYFSPEEVPVSLVEGTDWLPSASNPKERMKGAAKEYAQELIQRHGSVDGAIRALVGARGNVLNKSTMKARTEFDQLNLERDQLKTRMWNLYGYKGPNVVERLPGENSKKKWTELDPETRSAITRRVNEAAEAEYVRRGMPGTKSVLRELLKEAKVGQEKRVSFPMNLESGPGKDASPFKKQYWEKAQKFYEKTGVIPEDPWESGARYTDPFESVGGATVPELASLPRSPFSNMERQVQELAGADARLSKAQVGEGTLRGQKAFAPDIPDAFNIPVGYSEGNPGKAPIDNPYRSPTESLKDPSRLKGLEDLAGDPNDVFPSTYPGDPLYDKPVGSNRKGRAPIVDYGPGTGSPPNISKLDQRARIAWIREWRKIEDAKYAMNDANGKPLTRTGRELERSPSSPFSSEGEKMEKAFWSSQTKEKGKFAERVGFVGSPELNDRILEIRSLRERVGGYLRYRAEPTKESVSWMRRWTDNTYQGLAKRLYMAEAKMRNGLVAEGEQVFSEVLSDLTPLMHTMEKDKAFAAPAQKPPKRLGGWWDRPVSGPGPVEKASRRELAEKLIAGTSDPRVLDARLSMTTDEYSEAIQNLVEIDTPRGSKEVLLHGTTTDVPMAKMLAEPRAPLQKGTFMGAMEKLPGSVSRLGAKSGSFISNPAGRRFVQEGGSFVEKALLKLAERTVFKGGW